jgi:hypothetical protein
MRLTSCQYLIVEVLNHMNCYLSLATITWACINLTGKYTCVQLVLKTKMNGESRVSSAFNYRPFKLVQWTKWQDLLDARTT